MNFLNSAKLAVVGTVGLSAIAVLGITESAKAVDIQKGTDYFVSPAGGSTFVIDTNELNVQLGLGLPPGLEFGIPLGGIPIPKLPGNVDTAVQRKEDCNFVAGQCIVPIEMTQLSLGGKNIDINGTLFDIFATLDNSTPTTGEMKIRENGTFDSFLDIFFKIDLKLAGGGTQIGTFFDNFRLSQENARWSHTPPQNAVLVRGNDGDLNANCHNISGSCDPNDFFTVGVVEHRKGSPTFPRGHRVRIATVPEPSTALATLLVGLGTMFGLQKKGAFKKK